MDAYVEQDAPRSAVEFTGNWKEFLPIAASNFLLTVVTLGIYRFWAKARERRYLWSRTHVIGDPLEWTGTGKEMFIGFLLVIALIAPIYIAFQFAIPALVARGQDAAAGILGITVYVAAVYLGAVGLFRALRYRLSRSWWRGIRGGSNDPGWSYGLKALGYTAAAFFTAGLLYPWAKTRLWNLRWNAMSFGGLDFEADLHSSNLYGRWLALYIAPIIAILLGALGVGIGAVMAESMGMAGAGFMVIGVIFLIVIYLVFPLFFMAFWAKFYREAADVTELGGLQFSFDGRTWGWVKLWLGNIALAVVTLGFGLMFWTYRNWSFMARHLDMYGTVHVDELMQSKTRAPGESEGLADAFDIGAI